MIHADRALAFPPDWGRTLLGPRAHWPVCLSVTVDIMFNSPAAMLLMWSPAQIMLYNAAYVELCGDASLRPPGGNIPAIPPPAWSWNSEVIRQAWQGQPSRHLGQSLPTLHQGVIGQQPFDLYYTPIRDMAGPVAGILCTLTPGLAPALTQAQADSRLRILVVEDNSDARYLVCETLRAMGHEVDAVASGEEALPRLTAQDYDVLFADVSLPGMSGVELARMVLPGQPELALLFASGYGNDLTRHLEFPSSTLQKPYDIEQLQQALAPLRRRAAGAA